MTKTLVTGATGFIGAHVARLLVGRGDDVHVTVRAGSATPALEELGVTPVSADILDRRAIRRALRGVDRLFHLAGTSDLRLGRAQLSSVVVEGTRIVLEEALRAEVQRAVYTSSVAAIGPAPPGRLADERSPWRGARYGIPYLDACHQAEAAAMRLVDRGLPLVIVNPAHVLGAGDPGRSSTALVRRFLRRQIPAYVDGTLNIVGVQDVAAGHLLADQRGAVGERYILGNRNFTLTRLFADLGRLSGVQPPTLKLPVTVAMSLAAAGHALGDSGWLSAAGARLGAAAWPTPVEIRAACLRWSFSNRKAKRELGWEPSPHEDCLEDTIRFYRERDAFSLAPPGAMQPLALRVAGEAFRRAGL
jgi:dihydroflavonol-4-reductase